MLPITIFSRTIDPAGVARLIRELAPSATIDGSEADWKNASITFSKWFQKKKLTLTHNPAYYAQPDWSRQMNGMRNFISGNTDCDEKRRAMTLTTSFKFAIGTLVDPEISNASDPRLPLICAVAEYLDGVLFTPAAMLDPRGL